jgi:fosfomycin resistance protein FosX
MIEGISHITFVVRDLEKFGRIVTDVLGGREIYSSGDRTFSISREKFFLVGEVWMVAMEGEAVSERTYNHIAFKVRSDDVARQVAAIERLGLEIRQSRSRIAGEGMSVYFYDYDNHLFELHTGTLSERLRAYSQMSESSDLGSG